MTDATLDRLSAALRPNDDAPDQPTEGWSIHTLDDAAWASRKAAAARREIAKATEWGEREIARIRALVADETARHERDATFFENHLAVFLRAEIAAGRKTKSLELPGGTIKVTARQPKLDVDAEAFLPWAVATRPDLVRLKQEVDKAGLKRIAELAEDGVVVIDGEVVPGASWEAQEDSASFVAQLEVQP